MNKRFYSAGFFYNPRNNKVLLQRNEPLEGHDPVWSTFGGVRKLGETPLKTVQRALYESTRVRPLLTALHELYDYFNDDENIQRYVYFAYWNEINKKEAVKGQEHLEWHDLEDALHMDLETRSRQDLVFFEREMNAKREKLPHTSVL